MSRRKFFHQLYEELLKLNICAVDKPGQRFFFDKISVNIRGNEALGVKFEQYGGLLNDNKYVTALNFPIISSPLTERAHLQDHPHLQELELADIAESLNSIDILICSDHYWDFVAGESIRGDFGPTAVKSKLGWLLSGLTNNSQNETSVISNLVITVESFSNGAKESDEMADMLERLWDVESLEIVDTNCESELMKRKGNITFNASHYKAELPWRGDCLPQSNNYGMCVTVIAFKIEEGAEFAERRKRKKGIVENCAGDRRSNAR